MLIEHNVITGKREFASAARQRRAASLQHQGRADLEQRHQLRARRAVRRRLALRLFKGNRLHHSRYGTHYMNSYYNLWEDNDTFYNRGGLALMECATRRCATTAPGATPTTASCCARCRTR